MRSELVENCCEQAFTYFTAFAPLLGQTSGRNEREADFTSIIAVQGHLADSKPSIQLKLFWLAALMLVGPTLLASEKQSLGWCV